MTSFDTRCVHGGARTDHDARPLTTPIVQSTSYAWHGVDGRPEFSYAREGNPTVAALERRLAVLEGGPEAVCFSSGLAALDALLRTVPAGGRVLVARHLYGGTTRLANQIHGDRIVVETVDTTDRSAIDDACATPADLFIVETPSNPTLQITDLALVIEAGHRAGATVAVDNTFLTPIHQQPLSLGADVVIHSTTKYLDGHGATLGGAIITDASRAQACRAIRIATGAVLAPGEAWLTLQGCKTLHLRTERQFASAGTIASRLAAHASVQRVIYPGLADHPGRAVHQKQATGDGAIIAVDLGSAEVAARFASTLRLFQLAENLGSTESLVSSPALMTHAALGAERRAADGIDEGIVRLSVGVESVEELWSDLEQALAALVVIA